MGLYDSLYMKCPNCNFIVEFQSKAGLCELSSFTFEDCPMVILNDLNNKEEECHKCESTIKIELSYGVKIKVNCVVPQQDEKIVHSCTVRR